MLSAAATILVTGLLFAASLETLRVNDKASMLDKQPAWQVIKQADNLLQPYSVVNTYGLFRRMTGRLRR